MGEAVFGAEFLKFRVVFPRSAKVAALSAVRILNASVNISRFAGSAWSSLSRLKAVSRLPPLGKGSRAAKRGDARRRVRAVNAVDVNFIVRC